jgi:hypothetical protein
MDSEELFESTEDNLITVDRVYQVEILGMPYFFTFFNSPYGR